MSKPDHFKISSHLKDIIGRDLVTNEFVAIFELVKNGFDAQATRVEIEFNPEAGTITIVDDGQGMSADDIRDKWLFVAYSERALAADKNYRDKIKPAGQFAGSKGIGRFACDTLGETVELYSKKKNGSLARLEVDWRLFEADSTDEFQKIDVDLGPATDYPEIENIHPPGDSGTVIVIRRPRQNWDADRIKRLRRDLAKLIDPFGTTNKVKVSTWLVDGSDVQIEDVDGEVGNQIADLLEEKTSRIDVRLYDGEILTTLSDRGRRIYSVKEPLPYDELRSVEVNGSIYFLNRAAKATFTRRMGLRSVHFGSIFLFLNGFRISPIGDETDDTFGLNRRKQQGSSRYFGTRDVLGRVDVTARPKMFREVSSRDAGLIDDAHVRALYDAIRKFMIFRLERYVVGVNWQDKLDLDRDTATGLDNDTAKARVLSVLGSLTRQKDVEIIDFDEKLVSVGDDPERLTEQSLNTIAAIAERQGNRSLTEHVEIARERIARLQAEREEARQAATRAAQARDQADARIEALERQAAFLGSSLDVDIDRVQLLMHQAEIHAGHIKSAIANAIHENQEALKFASSDLVIDDDDLEDSIAALRQKLRRTENSLASAQLSSTRLKTVLSFAPNISVDLETDRVEGDIVQFIAEYIDIRQSGIPDMPDAAFETDGASLDREFSPVDVAIIIDNLMDNARKAKASKVIFNAQKKTSKSVSINVSDDGVGIDQNKVDLSKIFDRGYTSSPRGTGLGLYNVKLLLESMGGTIAISGDGSRADFEIVLGSD